MFGASPFASVPFAGVLRPLEPIAGSVSLTEEDDSLSASGVLPIKGAVAVAEDDDTLAAAGIFVAPRFGAVNVTEDDDVLAASGALPIFATAHLIEDDDAAEVRAIVRGAAFRYAKARYEAPPVLIARYEAPLENIVQRQAA